jgi:hypothetical protein
MNINLITITWNYLNEFNIEDTYLFKSFKKFNPNIEFMHFHFNRNEFAKEEKEYSEKFGEESEYILYKINMLCKKLKQVSSDYIIFCDANDVFCLDSISRLPLVFDLEKNIVVGAEKNQWPIPERKKGWVEKGFVDYSGFDSKNELYLNSGVILAKRENFIKMLEIMEEKIMTKNIKNFKNDQAIYTWYYTSNFKPSISLDYSNIFTLNTFKRQENDFYITEDKKIVCKNNAIKPCFIHDNGWNHGSPKFINKFELKNII